MSTIKIFIVSIATLFLSSCVKSLEDEGVSIDNVTHFLYGGYNYQVHPDLGLMSWDAANVACRDLIAEGHDDWFLPTMGEMQAARNSGLYWVQGWTSTANGYCDYYSYYYCLLEYGFRVLRNDDYVSVMPMRKQ